MAIAVETASALPRLALIGGRWVEGSAGTFEVRNPYSGELVNEIARCAPADVDLAVAAAGAAQPGWAATPLIERVKVFTIRFMLSRLVRLPRIASIVTMRANSSGPRPAIGSSSSSMRGLEASAIASSSWRCSPWLSAEAGKSARALKPARASAARAGLRSSGSRRALRQKWNEWPARACTASATLSSTLRSRKSDVI